MEIIGYTYKAENYTPAGLIHALIAEGRLSPGAWSLTPETALDQLAEYEGGIDRQDEYSFDSDAFPKVIFFAEDDEEFTDGPSI